jgi:hypothetical protein
VRSVSVYSLGMHGMEVPGVGIQKAWHDYGGKNLYLTPT